MALTAHVVPLRDLVEHEVHRRHRCVCGPDWHLHAEGWVIVHHSLDGRELTGRPPFEPDTPDDHPA